MANNYLIGIDGGGTSSRLLAMDLAGNELCSCRGKSISLESNHATVVKNNLLLLLNKMQSSFGLSLEHCLGMCVGTAGVDTEYTRLAMENMLDDLGMNFPIKVVNDSEIALYANTHGKAGIMIISGTGSIGYGLNEEKKTWRVGGFGYLVGDQGSAYWVGAKGIEAALMAYDHSKQDTCLINDFCKYLNLNSFDEILDFVYQKNKSDLAQLAYVVDDAREKKDAVAAQIMDEALDSLMLLISTLVRELNMKGKQYPVVLGGGFLMHTKWLNKSLRVRISTEYPWLNPTVIKEKAELGAVYMAADMLGLLLPMQLKSENEKEGNN